MIEERREGGRESRSWRGEMEEGREEEGREKQEPESKRRQKLNRWYGEN